MFKAIGGTALLLTSAFAQAFPEFMPPGYDVLFPDQVSLQPKNQRESSTVNDGPVGYFFRDLSLTETVVMPLNPASKWMTDVVNYRTMGAKFPDGMDYHFDGLSHIMKLNFSESTLSIQVVPLETNLYNHYNKCIFLGSGTGPTLGTQVCFQNPMVNLLPIQNELWITIDTFAWGRVDPVTLETVTGARVNVSAAHSFTLNAHPPCDPGTGQCFVQHPCPAQWKPWGDQACFSELIPDKGGRNMQLKELARVTLTKDRLIQHSHAPCLTENFLVAHIDHFSPRADILKNNNSGMLKELHQLEDDEWMVMDRRDNSARILHSDLSFINNHFWNCYESATDGGIVVETVAVTRDYLDQYFYSNLAQSTDWSRIFLPAQRCVVPFTGESIHCAPLLQEKLYFDYPTYNPLFKTSADYTYFYALAATNLDSRWLDQIVKIDRTKGQVVARWAEPGCYPTEADFIPRASSGKLGASEDDGVLLTMIYNSTADSSFVGLLSAKTLQLLDSYPMGVAVPFHAHGIICLDGHCFPNP